MQKVKTNKLWNIGFRPIRSQEGSAFLARMAEEYGYDVQSEAGTHWLRKRYRQEGRTVPNGIIVGPTIRRFNLSDPHTYDFLELYERTAYAHHQNRIRIEWDNLVRTVMSSAETEHPYVRFNRLTRALTFCPTRWLRRLLQEHLLPTFFAQSPEARVQILLLNGEVEKSFGFLRAGYALGHYSQSELLQSQDKGFASLREWEKGQPLDYVDPLLSILQVCMYPYIPLFHGGPFGLPCIFLFSEPYEHEPGYFPQSWLQWARSESAFGTEAVDPIRGLSDTRSEEFQRLSHRRYITSLPLPAAEFTDLVAWSIDRLAVLIREVADPANFDSADGYIDFSFAFEHNLSVIRVLRRALLALSTEEAPSGKFFAFEVADLLDRLALAFGKRGDGETFKLLFNPIDGRDLLKRCLRTAPDSAKNFGVQLADALYADLGQTISASIWIHDKIERGGVKVKTSELATEKREKIGEFVGNLLRTLRNTHHGYFTRLDKKGRPSRYLALTTGDTPDSLASLPFIWVMAFLADASELIGWRPLPVSTYTRNPSWSG